VPLVLGRIPLRWSAGGDPFLLKKASQDFEPIASRVLLGALADLIFVWKLNESGRLVVFFSLVDYGGVPAGAESFAMVKPHFSVTGIESRVSRLHRPHEYSRHLNRIEVTVKPCIEA
jgi:hypothetical protein